MRRSLIILASLVLLLILPTNAALAFHCTVANKPTGAGAGTFADVRPAGDSGNLVFTGGAFMTIDGTDIFARGRPVDIGVKGFGSLPGEAHDNGGDNGVTSVHR